MNGEVDVVQHVTAQAVDLQDDSSPLGGLGVVIDLLELAPDDELDEMVLRQSRYRPRDDLLAVAQDSDALRELEHLVEVVRHEHDGNAGVRDSPGERVQPLGFGVRQVRRRLVQDEHLGRAVPGGQSAGHGQRGALAHGQAVDRAADVEVVAELGQRRTHALALLPPADAAAEAGVSDAEGEVVHGVQVVDEAEVLVDESQPERLARGTVAQVQWLSVHLGRSLVGKVKPGEDLDKRRLAGPVLADERAYLSRFDRQAHAVQDPRASEALRHVRHGQRGCHAASWRPERRV